MKSNLAHASLIMVRFSKFKISLEAEKAFFLLNFGRPEVRKWLFAYLLGASLNHYTKNGSPGSNDLAMRWGTDGWTNRQTDSTQICYLPALQSITIILNVHVLY